MVNAYILDFQPPEDQHVEPENHGFGSDDFPFQKGVNRQVLRRSIAVFILQGGGVLGCPAGT